MAFFATASGVMTSAPSFTASVPLRQTQPCTLPSGADFFAVELAGAPREAPELAVFLSALKPLTGLFYSRPLALSCDGRTWDCRLKLEDGTTVLWGKFEFTRLKVLRLNEVMKDASLKTGGPLRADLRSFREGKIFVSALK